MKRIASAILLSLFLYNIVGYYFSYSVLNWENSSQMSLNIKSSNNLETLQIKKSELNNVIFSDNEMSYQGEIYDVKKISSNGDYILVQCLHDKKEETLFADLDKQIQNNLDAKSSSTDHQGKSGQKNIVKDYFFSVDGISFYNASHHAIFKAVDPLIHSFVASLSTPPPRQV
jgi:hypothetical protein